jgi:hypothetical protein
MESLVKGFCRIALVYATLMRDGHISNAEVIRNLNSNCRFCTSIWSMSHASFERRLHFKIVPFLRLVEIFWPSPVVSLSDSANYLGQLHYRICHAYNDYISNMHGPGSMHGIPFHTWPGDGLDGNAGRVGQAAQEPALGRMVAQ